MREKDVLPFLTTCMDFENIILREINQGKANAVHRLQVEFKKYNKLVNIKQKQTHRYREQNTGYQWGEGRGRGVTKVRN